MLVDILYLIVGVMLNIIADAFSLIQFVFPSFTSSAVSTVLQYGQYAQGFWPIQQTLLLAGFAFVFVNGMFVVRFFLWVIGWVPWFGGQSLKSSHGGVKQPK